MNKINITKNQNNSIEILFSLLKGQYNLVASKAHDIHGFPS
jgi:hypothetical protein